MREVPRQRAVGAHLSLFLRELTSRFMASAVSVASSSSRCSFRREALARWASSSASSSCRLSCFRRVDALSACGDDVWPVALVRGSGRVASQPHCPACCPICCPARLPFSLRHQRPHLVLVLLGVPPLVIHLQQHILQLLLRPTHLFAGCLALPA